MRGIGPRTMPVECDIGRSRRPLTGDYEILPVVDRSGKLRRV
jgi:hypothetical protein